MWILKKKEDRIGGHVGDKMASVMRTSLGKISKRLDKRTATFSKKKWLILLGIFCLTFGSLSAIVIYASFTTQTLEKFGLPRPGSLRHFSIPSPTPVSRPSQRDIEKLKRFESHLDSLSAEKIDSLRLSRPGLFDTLERLKRVFRDQNIDSTIVNFK